jgi:hypothetical protein
LAEWLCRTVDRIDPARVFGLHHCLGRGTSALESKNHTPITTTPPERIGLCTRMRRFLVRFIRPEAFAHTRSLVDFITNTSESRFSVHTGRHHQDFLVFVAISMIDLASWLGVTRAFGVIAGHLPSAILILPKPVSRSPPKTSSIYPKSISRALCSAGMRCIKPLAPSRNETNSSRVNAGADKTWAITRLCANGWPVQASHPATIKPTHY